MLLLFFIMSKGTSCNTVVSRLSLKHADGAPDKTIIPELKNDPSTILVLLDASKNLTQHAAWGKSGFDGGLGQRERRSCQDQVSG